MGHKNVARFDIAVDEAEAVKVGESFSYLVDLTSRLAQKVTASQTTHQSQFVGRWVCL